ncbi:hypothetical protein R3P38DRAFT_2779647 [Favolaschia claudopus]|uniref:Uncharacterized protein n=1 Tax=Favolaschia claudopus TaxID=2862362 RepID=A0AAW0BDK1_9AGAR
MDVSTDEEEQVATHLGSHSRPILSSSSRPSTEDLRYLTGRFDDSRQDPGPVTVLTGPGLRSEQPGCSLDQQGLGKSYSSTGASKEGKSAYDGNSGKFPLIAFIWNVRSGFP